MTDGSAEMTLDDGLTEMMSMSLVLAEMTPMPLA